MTLGSRISQDLQVLFSREKRWAREEEKEKEKERGEREREREGREEKQQSGSFSLFIRGWLEFRSLSSSECNGRALSTKSRLFHSEQVYPTANHRAFIACFPQSDFCSI